jgi:hypothetical protein
VTKDCQLLCITNTSGALGGCPETCVFHQSGVRRAKSCNAAGMLPKRRTSCRYSSRPVNLEMNRRCQPSIGASASANARAVSQVTASTEDQEASAPNVVPTTPQRRRRPPPKVCPSRGEHRAAQIAVLRPRSVDILLCERVAGSPRLYLTVHVIVRQVGAGRAVAPVAARSLFAVFQTSPVGDGMMRNAKPPRVVTQLSRSLDGAGIDLWQRLPPSRLTSGRRCAHFAAASDHQHCD